jgi:sulfite dehydrogenase
MNKIVVGVGALAVMTLTQAKSIVLGSDSIAWRESTLPGYTLVSQKCAICHSAHYAEYQPPNTKTGYWKAQVLRMKNVFNAPVTDEEVPAIVEYLDQTYGAHRK